MCRSKVFIICVLAFIIPNSFASTTSASYKQKEILVIYTFCATNTAYQLIQTGIVEKLDSELGDSYNLHQEYLEADRFPAEAEIKKHIHDINDKFSTLQLDLLIVVGVNGLVHVKNYGSPFLVNLPTINFDFDLSKYGIIFDKYLNDKTVYIGLEFDLGFTISNALEIFPETDTVYFISGSAPIDYVYREMTKTELKKLNPDISLQILHSYSMEELLYNLSQISQNKLIFFANYKRDGKGLPFYSLDAINLIKTASPVPVISYSDLGLGDGAFGGRLLSLHKGGIITGEAAIKILDGDEPSSLVINKEDYYEYQFDWRELVRFNVDLDRLPAGYELLYKEHSFIEIYKWLILGVLMFLILQTILILNLVLLSRKQKNMIKQVRETENKLREFSDEDRILRIGQMSASLSHELIQPLTAILSTAQAGIRFIDSEDCSPKFLRELFENIIEDEKRTTSILRSIMGMMKLESRVKEKIDLNLLMNEVVALFHNEAINYNVKLIVNLTETPNYVLADKVQIQQVILNLLLNAAQAMDTTIDYNKFISLSITNKNRQINIAVCDNGVGFDPCVIKNLFKPFISTKEKGLGIGLSICRTIIEEHEGEIKATNLPEGGAKIDITLNSYD